MSQKKYIYEIEMEVRDYECDIQGIVENSVYQSYMSHARHKFLQFIDMDFAQLHNDGIDALVTKSELEYKSSLRPSDIFVVRIYVILEGRIKFVFNQDIYRKSDNKLIIKGKITGVLTKRGRPIKPDIMFEKLNKKGIEVANLKK